MMSNFVLLLPFPQLSRSLQSKAHFSQQPKKQKILKYRVAPNKKRLSFPLRKKKKNLKKKRKPTTNSIQI